jgi:hypothetical protein
LGFIAKVSRGTHEVRMRITHLVTTQSSTSILVDHHSSTETMIDDTANSFSIVTSDAECTQPTDTATHEHVSER